MCWHRYGFAGRPQGCVCVCVREKWAFGRSNENNENVNCKQTYEMKYVENRIIKLFETTNGHAVYLAPICRELLAADADLRERKEEKKESRANTSVVYDI